MSAAIRVEGLRKRYQIGGPREPYGTLRDALRRAAASAWPSRAGRSRREEPHLWAVDGLTFDVDAGEVVGLVGRNGAGKSTLLKLLSRITPPTEGRIELRGRVGSLLEVGTGFHPELTGRENIFLNGAILGMRRSEIRDQFEAIVAFAEIAEFLDTPVKRYSSGMYTRLAFAVAAHLDTEILLVDEVLAVGDAEFQRKCLRKMGDATHSGRTVIFVSHNMSAVAAICGRALLLERGKLKAIGSVGEVVDLYLGEANLNQVSFENQAVTRAEVQAVDGCLEITAEYRLDRPVSLPCLGFIVSDVLGNPIYGTNAKIDGMGPQPCPTKTGRIRVVVSQPRLLDGTYRLSLWFGDGHDDFFSARDCLVFEVVRTEGFKRVSARVNGPVVPECRWHLE